MKKSMFVIIILITLNSCRSNRDNCIEDLVDNKGYSYNDACDTCDEMASDSVRE